MSCCWKRKPRVKYHDPYIAEIKEGNTRIKSTKLENKTLSDYDCVVITTDHTCYKLDSIAKNSKLVFDTRGCTVGIKADNIIRLGV